MNTFSVSLSTLYRITSEVKSAFPAIPNLSTSTLPIKGLIARYEFRDKHYDEALRLLKESENAFETYQKGMKIARKIGDNHAFSELQSAFNIFNNYFFHHLNLVKKTNF